MSESVNQFQVTIIPSTPAPGERIVVVWEAPADRANHQQDYVALFGTAGEPMAGLIHQVYTFGKPTGSATWLAPTTLGSYYAEYLLDNGDVTEAISNTIVIGDAQPDYRVIVAPTNADINEQVKVSWIVKDGVPTDPTDWLGLYRLGTPNENHIAWFYVTHPETERHFTMTFGAGQYVVRYLVQDGYDSVAESAIITVS